MPGECFMIGNPRPAMEEFFAFITSPAANHYFEQSIAHPVENVFLARPQPNKLNETGVDICVNSTLLGTPGRFTVLPLLRPQGLEVELYSLLEALAPTKLTDANVKFLKTLGNQLHNAIGSWSKLHALQPLEQGDSLYSRIAVGTKSNPNILSDLYLKQAGAVGHYKDTEELVIINAMPLRTAWSRAGYDENVPQPNGSIIKKYGKLDGVSKATVRVTDGGKLMFQGHEHHTQILHKALCNLMSEPIGKLLANAPYIVNPTILDEKDYYPGDITRTFPKDKIIHPPRKATMEIDIF